MNLQALVSVSQYDTERVLREHLAEFGVQVQQGTEPVAIEQDAECVTVTLKRTGKDGEEEMETLKATYVIGADGARGKPHCRCMDVMIRRPAP